MTYFLHAEGRTWRMEKRKAITESKIFVLVGIGDFQVKIDCGVAYAILKTLRKQEVATEKAACANLVAENC